MFVLLPLSFLTALVFGAVDLSLATAITALLGDGDGAGQGALIIREIRLPRALLAALVGALLGICGAASQGLFRNPLADPSLIGVTAGASAGASLVIVSAGSLLGSAWGVWLLSLGAFVGGMATVWLVYRLATGPAGTSVASMLLAGIAITAMAGSLTSLLSLTASNDLLRRISLWQMGGLEGANTPRVLLAFILTALLLVLLPRYARALNALLLGESEARHLGFDTSAVQRALVVLIALGVGSSVALAGTIAFVGLVVPHMVRLICGPDHRLLLPLSAVAGAVLLLLADTAARSVAAPAELPVGLLTALVGAPFFLFLLRRREWL
ncbi:FecCD family ABC transporter permease [Gilvimarinus sp. F26214L]|uniref:FecCD family ABC transporter permease n=1 Tax=Gilvimarinus sp. DZF01 TaxID=3461371 RepID=UPI004045B787